MYYVIMTEFVKSNWVSDGENISLSMPLAKVDKENRLVSGYATLDNIDSQGDVVLAEASAKAFSRARGNLREMHDKIAVGRVVDFREDEFYDSETQKFYRGIFVTAYVSTGAQSTWEKVLDGTLSGFSIGGSINEVSSEFVKSSDDDEGRTVRFIKDYDLVELSLVDNPANQLANVFSITKSATGSVTVKGMAVDTEIENVFWCAQHPKSFRAVQAEEAKCVECGTNMENIGWFETGENRAEKVRDVVNKFLGLTDANAADENAEGEGGVEMAKGDESVETGHEAGEPTEVPTPAEPADEVPADEPVEEVSDEETEATEADTDPDEVVDEEEAISKKIDELKDAVNETLEKTRTETSEQVAALEKKIDEINESFVAKASELEGKFNEFGEKLETAKSRLAEFEKSLEAVNSSEAFKKSADLEEDSAVTVQKSSKTTWNGAFSVNDLLR